jgi:hypothetical protein
MAVKEGFQLSGTQVKFHPKVSLEKSSPREKKAT